MINPMYFKWPFCQQFLNRVLVHSVPFLEEYSSYYSVIKDNIAIENTERDRNTETGHSEH